MGRQDLRSRTPLRAVGRCPTPCKPFEKGLSETFSCLFLIRAQLTGLPQSHKPILQKKKGIQANAWMSFRCFHQEFSPVMRTLSLP